MYLHFFFFLIRIVNVGILPKVKFEICANSTEAEGVLSGRVMSVAPSSAL